MKLILQTRRLTLRELEKEDVGALRLILQDPLVMYAWEHAFTDAEIRGWIETNQARYQKDGCGYWAATPQRVRRRCLTKPSTRGMHQR